MIKDMIKVVMAGNILMTPTGMIPVGMEKKENKHRIKTF